MLTLLNPHIDDFMACPVSFRLVGRKPLVKYGYLIEEQIRRFGAVDVLIDGTISSLFSQRIFGCLPKIIRLFVLREELRRWKKINNFMGNVKIHWTPETITNRQNIYLFSYKNCTGHFESRRSYIEAFDRKIVNLSHFMIRTLEKSKNARSLKNVVYTSEADLSDQPFFTEYFGGSNSVLPLAFCVASRFENKTPYQLRADRCAAVGSFHNLENERPSSFYKDVMTFFQTDTYHPVRKLVYENQHLMDGYVNCAIAPFRESRIGLLRKLDVRQKSYFSFDVVDFYNNNRYALVGEEIYGLPGIGFFEAMACGCAVLGQSGHFYKGLGLVSGVHYVEHDGTLEGIKRAIDYLRKSPEKAQEIAEKGKEYTTSHCRPDALFDKLLTYLDQDGLVRKK